MAGTYAIVYLFLLLQQTRNAPAAIVPSVRTTPEGRKQGTKREFWPITCTWMAEETALFLLRVPLLLDKRTKETTFRPDLLFCDRASFQAISVARRSRQTWFGWLAGPAQGSFVSKRKLARCRPWNSAYVASLLLPQHGVGCLAAKGYPRRSHTQASFKLR